MKRKPPLLTLTLFVPVSLVTAVSSPLSSAVVVPAALKPFAWPLFLGFAFLLGLIATLQYFLQEKTDPPVLTLDQQYRQRMLDKVCALWIRDVLEQSLDSAALIALGLQEQPDAVASPPRRYLQLPPGIRITQVYDDADGELLILGEPGSGKTTLLLELARDLLDRAKSDDNLPMPVVFNLSSWAAKRQSLADWLVEEMNTKYQVSRDLAQPWVYKDKILPMLDGLDEVAWSDRSACVEAINAFRREHGLLPMVVCSRSADYFVLKQRLLLGRAVLVQPLTKQQIDEYLSSVGEPMEAVREALHDDPVLQELATTPLLLKVQTLAYHGVSTKDFVAAGSLEDLRRRLFDDYVMAMLKRRRPKTQYGVQQTLCWLRCLARQLVQHNQTEFYLERLQEDWLANTRSRLIYRVVVCLVFGLIFGLVCGLVGGLVGGLFGGLVGGLVFGLVGGLVGGLVFGLVFGLRKEIKPAEVITWSWQSVWKQLAGGLVYRVVLCLVFGLVVVLVVVLFRGLVVVLASALVGVLLVMLFSGLSREMLDTQKLAIPNRGIWRSARYGLVFGLVSVLAVGLVAVLVAVLVSVLGAVPGVMLVSRLGVMLGVGLVVGLGVGLSLGGEAFMQHFILRWFLWLAGLMTWNSVRFLDYAAECILLRKVGGGYIFIHRLLLEYFVRLDDASIHSHEGAIYL